MSIIQKDEVLVSFSITFAAKANGKNELSL